MSNVPTLTNPCCFGISLQSGTKIIAAIHIGIIGLVMIILTLYLTFAESMFESSSGSNVTALLVLLLLVILIVVAFIMSFYVILFLGANRRDIDKIRIYLVFFTVEICMNILFFLDNTFGGDSVTFGGVLLSFFVLILASIPKLYMGYVVFRFFKELENEQPAPAEYLETIPYP